MSWAESEAEICPQSDLGICEGGFSLGLTRPVVCFSGEKSHLVELGHR